MTWQRIQLSRRKGARMPPNSRSCARPSRWGNPYTIEGVQNVLSLFAVDPDGAGDRYWYTRPNDTAAALVAIEIFADVVAKFAADRPTRFTAWLAPLRDCDYLACWCAPDQPCHVDVLIEWLERVYGDAT